MIIGYTGSDHIPDPVIPEQKNSYDNLKTVLFRTLIIFHFMFIR